MTSTFDDAARQAEQDRIKFSRQTLEASAQFRTNYKKRLIAAGYPEGVAVESALGEHVTLRTDDADGRNVTIEATSTFSLFAPFDNYLDVLNNDKVRLSAQYVYGSVIPLALLNCPVAHRFDGRMARAIVVSAEDAPLAMQTLLEWVNMYHKTND